MSNNGVVIWGSQADSKSEQEVVDSIKEQLANEIPESAISNISLPTLATQGAEITWESSHPDVISTDGTVERPSVGSEDKEVELTASISLGEVTDQLTIQVTVPAEEEGRLAALYDFNEGLS